MPLSPGMRFGVYEIAAPIGAGGMGQVWRAIDTTLGRPVAIKVLPDAVATDRDRVLRFEREARTLAALNHPHIAAIYGFEKSTDGHALVMELVEGEDLSHRIARGAIPVDEALPIARQIAEALESAHDAGIIHRDLKPANVKIRGDGTVKILDFGLAKVMDPDERGPAASLADSPTHTSPAMTVRGVILGTAPYMSPEQAAARPVDRRTDLWAFGVVLFEMLTGKPVFTGESVTHVLASVLKTEPDWSALPSDTPPAIRRLLRRCLEKNRKQRIADASDVRLEIEEALLGGVDSAPAADTAFARLSRHSSPRRGTLSLLFAATVAIAVFTSFAVSRFGGEPGQGAPAVIRVLISVAPADRLRSNSGVETLTEGRPSRTAIALSPDGRTLVYSAMRASTQQLWLRPLDQLEATPIPGTENGASPFFSPDGQWVGFWADGALKKVPLEGGAVTTICSTSIVMGASWGSNDTIAFARNAGGLWQVAAAGGTPRPLTSLDRTKNEVSHRLPHMLPGSTAVIFTITQSTFPSWENTWVDVQSLATGERKQLAQGSDARYIPTGHLVFMRNGVLLAAPFDLTRLEVTGGAVSTVPELMQAAYMPNVDNDSGAGQFTTSASGSLLYVQGGVFPDPERSLVWVDRTGASTPLPAPPRAYFAARISPDSRRVLIWTSGRDRNLWTYDISRGTMTRLTTEGRNAYGLWSDNERVIYRRELGPENIYLKAADTTGAAERLTTSENSQTPGAVSREGRTLVFSQTGPNRADIWSLSLDGDRRPRPILQTSAAENHPDLSPDGKWLAFTSDESGRQEVYVQPFPGPGRRHQISVDGGSAPAWSRDGKELFFQARTPGTDASVLTMMVVSVSSAPSFSAGVPKRLWQRPYPLTFLGYRGYDVAADGRFLMVDDRGRAPITATHMILVQNWTEELKRLVPAR